MHAYLQYVAFVFIPNIKFRLLISYLSLTHKESFNLIIVAICRIKLLKSLVLIRSSAASPETDKAILNLLICAF